MSDDELVVARASRWLAARDARAATPEEAAEFAEWLDADIRHRVAFLRIEADWQRADRLRGVRPLDRDVDPDLLERQPRRRQWLTGLAAGVVLALLGGTWAWQQHYSWQRYETRIGGFSRIVLDDGSVIDLNTNSDVRVRLRADRREVQLLRGEGRFQVAHDTQRPFVVAAAATAVRAVGTAFSVRLRDSEQVDVLVSEGKVATSPGSSLAGRPSRADEAHTTCVNRRRTCIGSRRGSWTW